jgi:hypothetical protein
VVAPDDAEQLWRRLCSVAYTIHVRESGNDGRPADDLPTADHQTEAAAITEWPSEMVQIPAVTLLARAGGRLLFHGAGS